MPSYFWKLHITNWTGTFMRNLRSDATNPSTSFADFQCCGTTPARQVCSKKYIKSKQIKDRRSTVSHLPLSPSASLLSFFLFPHLCLKTKTTYQKTKSYSPNNQHTSPPSSHFISLKRLHGLSENSFRWNPPAPFPSLGRPIHKNRMRSSVNTNIRARSLKHCRLYLAIRTSFPLLP